MMLEYFNNVVTGIQKRINSEPHKTNARKKYALEISKLGSRLYSDSGEKKIAWCGFLAPFDILNAMGVTSCFVEFIGAMLASTGMADTYINDAEQDGYAIDSCAYHRSVVGAIKKNVMPVPDFIIGTSCPCVAGLGVIENMARIYKKDLFVLNVPQENTVESVKYLSLQYRKMVEFVSAQIGNPLDEDKLREAMDLTNKARALLIEVYDLAKKLPSPANSIILKDYGIVLNLLMGTQNAVDVAKACRDEFINKIEEGMPGLPEEKIRLLWVQSRIQFRFPIEKILAEKFSANIVIDELNNIFWDPIDLDDPYTSIARNTLANPFAVNIPKRISLLQDLAKEYKIDGAINPCNWGCRQGAGARGLISNGLKKVNVPVLNLEVDCVDSRNFAEGQIMTRLEAFMEMLDNKPNPFIS